MMNIFDRRLTELLSHNSLSKRSLAIHVAVSAQSISDWSTGKVQPTADMLIKLADFFGCSIDYLVGREDDFGNISKEDTQTLSPEEQKLVGLFRQVSPARRLAIMDTVEGLSEIEKKQKNG